MCKLVVAVFLVTALMASSFSDVSKYSTAQIRNTKTPSQLANTDQDVEEKWSYKIPNAYKLHSYLAALLKYVSPKDDDNNDRYTDVLGFNSDKRQRQRQRFTHNTWKFGYGKRFHNSWKFGYGKRESEQGNYFRGDSIQENTNTELMDDFKTISPEVELNQKMAPTESETTRANTDTYLSRFKKGGNSNANRGSNHNAWKFGYGKRDGSNHDLSINANVNKFDDDFPLWLFRKDGPIQK